MPVSPTKIHCSYLNIVFIILACVILASSCTVVRKNQPGKPFVFSDDIEVSGPIGTRDKISLRNRLDTQIEDSVKPVFKSYLFIRNVMTAPPIFDSTEVLKTVENMNNLLHNSGFYRSEVVANWNKVDTVVGNSGQPQYRVHVNYQVNTGNVFKIDSIGYHFQDSLLLAILKRNEHKSLIKKGDAYSRQKVDEELNRVVDLFKDNGYFKMNRELIKAQLDTVDLGLLQTSLDPFEAILQQVESSKKAKNPTINISYLEIPLADTTIKEVFKVGRVSIMPDEPAVLTPGERPFFSRQAYGRYNIVSRYDLFKPSMLAKRIALEPDSLYRVSDYNQTLLNFNRIEAWQNVSISSRASDSIAGTVDFLIRMVPARKYFFSADLEGSSILTSQYQLYNAGNKGLALSFQLKNRNFAKRALQLENVLRTGVEFTNFSEILSTEIGLSNRLIFPKMVTPFKLKREKDLISGRSFVNLDGSYIDRYKYYKINTFNAYLGYDFQPRVNTNWQIRFPNIEFTRVYDKDSGFNQLIQDYPLLEYSYNDGLVIGSNATFIKRLNTSKPNTFSLLRLYGEESGVLIGSLLKKQTAVGKPLEQLYRFVKFSADFRHYVTKPKTMWAFRAFAGYGIGLETESRQGDISMPFFRQFFSGGPNSMRAWHLRKLGPGSSIFYDSLRVRTETPDGIIEKRFDDRFADIQLELNLEYRFDILPIYGYWLRGALFTDMGNIWIRKSENSTFEHGIFNVNRLYTDLAVAGGTGMRLDFKFFLLRFDLAWKLKDPLYASSSFNNAKDDGWLNQQNMRSPVFQFGIGYPF